MPLAIIGKISINVERGCLPTLLLVTLALNCVPIIFDEGNETSIWGRCCAVFDLIQQVPKLPT